MFFRLLMISSLLIASLAFGQTSRNISEYNLDSGIGLKGFDPVSVFPEGGSLAMEGKSENRVIHEGVTYYFATAANMILFTQKPEKYEPTYGSWCAYAMASGSTVDIKPDLFTINGNRAHYFVSNRAKKNFDKDLEKYELRADTAWKNISGESPRL